MNFPDTNPSCNHLADVHPSTFSLTFLRKLMSTLGEHWGILVARLLEEQGLSERMAFLKPLLIRTGDPLGAKIGGKVLLIGIHF